MAFPYSVFYYLDEEQFIIQPAHYLKPLHPKWSATPTDYEAFENALPPDKLPIVTMGPWVITEYKTDELLIMRRNPYYWKVDENGNQLPYFDEIQYIKGPSGAGRDLCVMAGDCDHMNLENPSTFVEAMTRAQQPDATFRVTWGPETLGYALTFNMSLDYGVKDDRDKAVRELLRDQRFRRALSHAIDRDGIAQAIMKGPFLRAWAGGLFPGAPEFDRESVVYYDYDPPSSNALLEQIGLKDTDGNGIVNWTEGPMAGQDVIIQLTANEDQREANNISEALVNQFAAVETPRSLLPFEKQLVDIILKYRDTYDAAERKKLMFEYNKIFTENLYDVGIFVGRYGLGLAKRVKNVPAGTPVFMYTWVEDAIMLDMLWTPVDQQLPQNRPETIPVYKK